MYKVYFLLSVCLIATKGQTSGIPDLVIPKIEPITSRAPNRPYRVAGKQYEPMNTDVPFRQRGKASWYGLRFHGRPTASGEIFNMNAMTAAHPTLPIPSYVRVTVPGTNRGVIVRVNDRGPFHAARVIDLSFAAAKELGITQKGAAEVEIERFTFEDIKEGKWQQSNEPLIMPFSPTATTESAAVISHDPLGALVPLTPKVPSNQDIQPSYWIQLAAVDQVDSIESFRERIEKEMGELALKLSVNTDGLKGHLQLGPFSGPVEAAMVARRVKHLLQLTPLIIQRS